MMENAAKNGCVEDIQYRVIDGVALSGRLYRPQGGADVLLIDVHGGAWSQGDRLNNVAIHTYLAEHGIAVFALDFRMAPAYRYPAAMEDVNFGVRWVKANLARLGLTPKIIGGLGTSSGGHQIVLNALRPDHADFFVPDASLADFDAGLDFVIACWPILNPLGRYRMAQEKGIENLIEAHQAFWPDEAAMRRANPTLMLERGEAVALPPMLMLQGTIDENVGHEGVDIFAAHYRKAGGAVELQKFIDQPHAFITQKPAADASIDALGKIRRYVEAFRKS
jgi:acetyl esterase